MNLSRRSLLAGLGLSLAYARPLSAQAGGGRKLVVVVVRGGMDGLAVAPPVGDPNYAAIRGVLTIRSPLPLEGGFALHPSLKQVQAMARAGQLRLAPAVATPFRERSHFEAQDVLESGGARVYDLQTGWLNRAVAALGPNRGSALSVGAQTPLILRGPAQARSWAPGGRPRRSERAAALVQDLYRDDPLLGPALASGLEAEALAQSALENGSPRLADAQGVGAAVAKLMRAPGGPDLVALSADGFDTHARQGTDTGQLTNRLALLDALLGAMQVGLGPVWDRTAVLVVTEFGRTVRPNGTGGTDHGTASTALLLGGAVRRGGIVGDFPGLAPAALYENRDLAPALDMRSLFKGVLTEHYGLDRRALDDRVFPGSAAAPAVTGLIRT